ncbi:hypothetical protein F53441_13309 [Fusarium austroafricanum]|uniref:FAD-binding PCMH-type domain-containing protein n=1 Tax=Fusarium austroafricanum TaxID=2364996 RepID=A0A8H4JNS2_9HYPO|nr:hypothetical protein F53441_13309 [Fusarium austroafricanum]
MELKCLAQVGFFKRNKVPVYLPGELEYEKSVANPNLLYRFARPACVVQPEHEFHGGVLLSDDTLLEVTIVIPDNGTVTVTSKDDENSDNDKLFWALCGAGGNNFGVVTKLKMKVEKLKEEQVVVAGT